MIISKAYAKINLTLDVLSKRPDGYHEVAMVMQSIDLADTICLYEREQNITLAVDTPSLPCDEGNLAYRAAALLRDRYQIKSGVHIELNKIIPMAAGLAGGSADAAAVLIGLNQLWKLGLSRDQLAELGADLGSDVPFCVKGGTMLATGRGEKLADLPSLPDCWVVLVKPPIGVATAWVYGNYCNTAVTEHPDTDSVIRYLEQRDLAGVAGRLCNVLESVTIPAHPEIGNIKKQMLEYGAMASLMSGSGPTVFGLVQAEDQARRIAAELIKCKFGEVFVAKVLTSNE